MRVIFTEAAKADVREILQTTRALFGQSQVENYRTLLADARRRVREFPFIGHHRAGLPPDGRLFHIGQLGRPASHFLMYRVDVATQTVEVLRVVHDAMDIEYHWPRER